MTPALLHQLMPRAPSTFADPLGAAMAEFGASTPLRQAFALANLAHESGEFRYMEEIADGSAYEDRADLGNNRPEAKAFAPDGKAGPWFKGHGPVQVTGYLNHLKYGTLLYPNDPTIFLRNPRQLCTPVDGCRAAMAFFREERCFEAADADNFLLFCQIVNMPPRCHGTSAIPNGWEHRKQYMQNMRSILLCHA